jgi:hypothetical protein
MNYKKNILVRIYLSLFLCPVILYCSNTHDNEQAKRRSETESVKAAIHNSIGWAKEKDFKLLYWTIANDTGYLEVDPGSRVIRGFDEFRKNESFWGNPDFKAIKYDIRDLTINLARNNDVAWFYCILDDINEWKRQPAVWMNTRCTGVLEKRKEKWVIVQMHFSFAKE